ncbi:helix-turn-helix domain-containing protein [Streptomyces lavendulocolor]|uniref:helix-turn-helix domain-containing protein n=1 Tax=Streptomyces lavendulocolor TaxID=67316 RepID=UPI003F4D362A
MLNNWVKVGRPRRVWPCGHVLCWRGGRRAAPGGRRPAGGEPGTVAKWRARFLQDRLHGLADEPRPGVPRTITDAQVEEVVIRTLEQTPQGGTHCSKRELAKVVGRLPRKVTPPPNENQQET